MQGEFLEIVRPTKLVYSWLVEDQTVPSRVTVMFSEQEDGTLVRVVHDRIATLDLAENHEMGWIGCLKGLSEYAAGNVSPPD